MVDELWRGIRDFEGLYEVSDLGRIRSVARTIVCIHANGNPYVRILKGKLLAFNMTTPGYLSVHLSVDGQRTLKQVHRLVSEAFLGLSSLQVNHKNGVKTDNNIDNLEYVTCSDNIRHSYENLFRKKHKLTTPVELYKDGKKYAYESILKAAKDLDVSPGSICSAYYRDHLCRGYGVLYV